MFCFLVEWEFQFVILIVWFYVEIDWVDCLGDVEDIYIVLVVVIICFQLVVIIVVDDDLEVYVDVCLCFNCIDMDCVWFVIVQYDDIWLCDFGLIMFMCVDGGFCLFDFCFIGWGGKFDVSLDDQLVGVLYGVGLFVNVELQSILFVLEGGGIEIDGVGMLLIIWQCLYECYLDCDCVLFSVDLVIWLVQDWVLWLDYGYLEGDDIDVYIDILVCFVLVDSIVYQVCDDSSDLYFVEFQVMGDELVVLCIVDGVLYCLFLLLWVCLVIDEGCWLVVFYVNYLIFNGVVLMLVYGDVVDNVVCDVLVQVYLNYEIVQVFCCLLIWQNGSLYCIIMQLLEGLLV